MTRCAKPFAKPPRSLHVVCAEVFRFNEERFLHGILVLSLVSDMGHGKAKGNGKAKHECHVCGKSGHRATSCPQLAQDVLKALTKQCRAEDLSEHLRQQKLLRCVGVKSRPRRSLKKASGHRGSLPTRLGKLLLMPRKTRNRLGSEVQNRSTEKRITCASLVP